VSANRNSTNPYPISSLPHIEASKQLRNRFRSLTVGALLLKQRPNLAEVLLGIRVIRLQTHRLLKILDCVRESPAFRVDNA
jgi:hypothetical protein